MTDKELFQEALKWQEHIKMLANDYIDDKLYWKRLEVFNWLITQAERNMKQKEELNSQWIKDD